MKIFRISPSPGHTLAFRRKTGLNEKTFAEQVRILKEENFLLPGGWATGMEKEGFEVFETLYNDFPLQGKWAEENNCGHLVLENDYPFEILKRQIAKFQPDVIFFYAGAFFWVDRKMREQLREHSSKPILITGFWGDELPPKTTYEETFGDLDLVFTSCSVYSKHFEQAGIHAVTTGNSFDDTIGYRKSSEPKRDVVFCGTTGYGYPDHVGRYEKLIQILRRFPLDIWTSEPGPSLRLRHRINIFLIRLLLCAPWLVRTIPRRYLVLPSFKRLFKWTLRAWESAVAPEYFLFKSDHPLGQYFLHRKPLKKLFPRRVKKPVLRGTDYLSLIADSKIVLNLHRDEDADIGNIRCFEATGVGACLLTDHGESLKEFFDVHNDIVTFTTVEDCLQKIDFLLKNPAEMKRIAANGQRATLSRHTIGHRCGVIAQTLKQWSQSADMVRGRTLLATYDLDKHPISFDVAFFLQAAEIQRKLHRADKLLLQLVFPKDIRQIAGVSKEVDAVVDAHARDFRIQHICAQLAERMSAAAVISVRDRSLLPSPEAFGRKVVEFPEGAPHHSEYYRIINRNPELMTGLSASIEAHRYLDAWLAKIAAGRKVICVTLRQYRVDTQRNSNLPGWAAFLGRLDPTEYAVVVLPDTDHIVDFKESILGRYPTFEPACFDVDLRLALYEKAYLNMFINNGPAVAATLDRKVRYLLFRILEPSVPHCSAEFLEWCGFQEGTTPPYASAFQKWVWGRDDEEILWREFTEMSLKIESRGGGGSPS